MNLDPRFDARVESEHTSPRRTEHADPADAERKRRLENELFVLATRRERPVEDPCGWNHRGNIMRVREPHAASPATRPTAP